MLERRCVFLQLVACDESVNVCNCVFMSALDSIADAIIVSRQVASVQECRHACALLRGSPMLALVLKVVKGPDGGLSLVQLASRDYVFLFDLWGKSGGELLDAGLREVLESTQRLLIVFSSLWVARTLARVNGEQVTQMGNERMSVSIVRPFSLMARYVTWQCTSDLSSTPSCLMRRYTQLDRRDLICINCSLRVTPRCKTRFVLCS